MPARGAAWGRGDLSHSPEGCFQGEDMATSPTEGGQRSSRGTGRGRRGARLMEPLSTGESSFGHKRLKGRYEIGAVLGHGSLGTTYRAHDRLLERGVAVKVLADRYAD